MSSHPVLVVMAAGLGSRYGGLKQIDPVGPDGQIILDYSLYDARRAGFERVVFIIQQQLQEQFEQAIGRRVRRHMQLDYVYQSVDRLPGGVQPPPGRVKPFGTGHAVWSIRGTVEQPFAIINADDYYGPQAFSLIYQALSGARDTDRYQYSMVGYRVGNTLTENGTVSRGVCQLDGDGYLRSIAEYEQIQRLDGQVICCQNGGAPMPLPEDTVVSMNLWGFTPSFLDELDRGFAAFYRNQLPQNPLKAEYYLPAGVDALIRADKARVRVLTTGEKWYGVTYQQDKPVVMAALRRMTEEGRYPAGLDMDAPISVKSN